MKAPKLLSILSFNDSRKVAIGVWHYIVSSVFFYVALINSEQWMVCNAICLTLIGGGTIADKYMEKKNDSNTVTVSSSSPNQ